MRWRLVSKEGWVRSKLGRIVAKAGDDVDQDCSASPVRCPESLPLDPVRYSIMAGEGPFTFYLLPFTASHVSSFQEDGNHLIHLGHRYPFLRQVACICNHFAFPALPFLSFRRHCGLLRSIVWESRPKVVLAGEVIDVMARCNVQLDKSCTLISNRAEMPAPLIFLEAYYKPRR